MLVTGWVVLESAVTRRGLIGFGGGNFGGGLDFVGLSGAMSGEDCDICSLATLSASPAVFR
jgi:hypothetical protein